PLAGAVFPRRHLPQAVDRLGAGARVRALLERQIPPAGRARYAGLPAADANAALVGLRRTDRVSGIRTGGAKRVVHAGPVAGELRGHRRMGETPGRTGVAAARGYDRVGAVPLWRPWRLGEPPSRRRFLRRVRTHLARRGHAHPREDRWQKES